MTFTVYDNGFVYIILKEGKVYRYNIQPHGLEQLSTEEAMLLLPQLSEYRKIRLENRPYLAKSIRKAFLEGWVS